LPINGNRANLVWILRSLADRHFDTSTRGVEVSQMNIVDRDRILRELNRKQTVAEVPFVSSTPLVGSWIARLRQLWNWMSTMWYVRPLTQQQNEFNETIVNTFSELTKHLTELGIASQLTLESSVENERTITRLNRELARLETRLRKLESLGRSGNELVDPPHFTVPTGK
jgi:hypothetical protein